MADEFSDERAGFAERLGKLCGGTTWREPLGGHGTGGDHLPDAHALAAALAFARRAPNDIGPDVLYAICCQRPTRRQAVVTELTAALLAASGRVGERCTDYLPQVSAACYVGVCAGATPVVHGMAERDWMLLSAMGQGFLWDAAESAMRRAERAYLLRDEC